MYNQINMGKEIRGQSMADVVSDLQADNRSLRRQLKELAVEVNLITDWIKSAVGLKLVDKKSKLYKKLHPVDQESEEIKKKLTNAEEMDVDSEGDDESSLEERNVGNSNPGAAVDPPVQVEDHGGQIRALPILPVKNLVLQICRLEDDPAANAYLLRQNTQQTIARRQRAVANGASSRKTLKRKNKKGTARPKFYCRYCRKEFQRLSKLTRHELVHTGELPVKCYFCEKACRTTDDLRKHLRTHTREKPYKCNICEKTFGWSGDLKEHQLRHAGVRKYKCHFCSSRFIINRQRVVHERTHTGEKPFSCQFCGRRFSRNANKQAHEMIHTGRKPFNCQTCQKEFRQRSQLKLHMKGVEHRNKANPQNQKLHINI